MSASVTSRLEQALTPVVADVAEAAMDAVYLGVGAGVLAFQKVQVQRRDLQVRLEKLGAQVRSR